MTQHVGFLVLYHKCNTWDQPYDKANHTDPCSSVLHHNSASCDTVLSRQPPAKDKENAVNEQWKLLYEKSQRKRLLYLFNRAHMDIIFHNYIDIARVTNKCKKGHPAISSFYLIMSDSSSLEIFKSTRNHSVVLHVEKIQPNRSWL